MQLITICTECVLASTCTEHIVTITTEYIFTMTVTDNPLYLIAFVSPLTNTVDFNLHTMAIASDVLNHLTGLLFVDTAPIIEAPTRIVFQNMA